MFYTYNSVNQKRLLFCFISFKSGVILHVRTYTFIVITVFFLPPANMFGHMASFGFLSRALSARFS